MLRININVHQTTKVQSEYGVKEQTEHLMAMDDQYMTLDAHAAAAMLRGLADRLDPRTGKSNTIYTGTINASGGITTGAINTSQIR